MKMASCFSKKLTLLLMAVCLLSPLTIAQNSQEAPANRSADATAANAAPQQESSNKDETEQFKHSGSVQMLARITGLSTDDAYWLAVVLNFVIIAALIAWAMKKNLPAMFRNRTASIQKAMEEARKASEDANRRLKEIETRLGRLGDEINQMRATSEKEAAAEEGRMKAAAAEDARRIVESAEQEIAAAGKAARRELTSYAADLAVTLAAKQIHVDAPTDRALVRRFAQQVSNGSAGKKT
jgi:F-type H+-transporting ATPase subunit b